jgi:hypothetical protein
MTNPNVALISPRAWALMQRSDKVEMLKEELFALMDKLRWIHFEFDKNELSTLDVLAERAEAGTGWMPDEED